MLSKTASIADYWGSVGPILLGCAEYNEKIDKVTSDWRDLPWHSDEDQVKLDVNRSFIYYPSSKCSGS